MGWSYATQAMLFEELAACSFDIALCVMSNMGLAATLLDAAAELRERYLPETLAGRLFGANGLGERRLGSHGTEIAAARDRDHLMVNGAMTGIINGVYSDVFVCAVRTESGLSHLLIDREAHGYEAHRVDRVALDAQSTTQILIADARVPTTNLIGEEGEGPRDMAGLSARASMHVGVLAVGLMRVALDESIACATKNIGFGKVIASHQLMAAKLADMAISTDAARLMCQRAFSTRDAGVRCDLQASMALAFAADAAVRVCGDAARLHGASGMTHEFDVERLVRDAMTISIMGGAPEMLQLGIARALTGVAVFE
jgi:alkylation response protein AidB-like acyl-CoA dehydrogenase